MSGFQFTRFEVYARQCPKKSKKGGRTAAEVLDENDRKPGNMPHVKNPHDPKLLYGVSIDEVRKMHDEVENATTTLKNGKTRKIRRTQNTLATCIASYPVPWSEIRGNKAEEKKLRSWLRDATGFIKGEWGDDLKSVILHTDEKYPHIHCLGLRADWDASMLHPGLAAAKGMTGVEAAQAAGNALIAVQDRYAAEVGERHGQCRIGPKPHRRLKQKRLTRRQWVEKQNKADGLARLIRREAAEVQKIRDQVAAEWAETSLVGKVAVSRKAIPAVQIDQAKAQERAKVSAEYGKRIDQEEARRVEAVGAERKKTKAAQRELASVRAELAAVAPHYDLVVDIAEATMRDLVDLRHGQAMKTGEPDAYRDLSETCEQAALMGKKTDRDGLVDHVRGVVLDVKDKAKAMFRRFFGWASGTEDGLSIPALAPAAPAPFGARPEGSGRGRGGDREAGGRKGMGVGMDDPNKRTPSPF
jgi:hypothetical protein